MEQMPTFVEPMLLRLATRIPDDKEFTFEFKMDGYRGILGHTPHRGVTVTHRSGNEATERYPHVVEELPLALKGVHAVLDSEIVGLDRRGKVDFDEMRRGRPNVIATVFDILYFHGQSLMKLPIEQRRNILRQVVRETDHIKVVDHFESLTNVAEAAIELNMEGVVAKRRNSLYRPSHRGLPRTWDWQKLLNSNYQKSGQRF